VRRDQKPGDYKDPGWFRQPPGTQAFEWKGAMAQPARFKSEGGQSMPSSGKSPVSEVRVRKPRGHSDH
jgi:hypothetical protein